MKRFFSLALLTASALALSLQPVYAGTDEYLGDTSIYAGIATTDSRPNVLFIIDNSRATLHTASGEAYIPWIYAEDGSKTANVYAQKTGCDGDDDPQNGCYLPWNIYEQDNQGDFAKVTLSNSTSALGNLKCDPSTDNSKPIHTVLQTYGSYSGSGVTPFPNISSDGTCDWKSNNSSGQVFALGNYLNYAGDAEGDDRIGTTDSSDVVSDDPCANLADPDVVKITTCPEGKYFNSGECKKPATSYFECLETHVSSAANSPLNEDSEDYPWLYKGTSEPSGSSPTEWATGNTYTKPVCEETTTEDSDTTSESTSLGDTQREIIYNALEKVIGVTAGVVNFAAMSYGDNNSGGKVLYDMADLSANVPSSDISETATGNKVFAPDCSSTGNASLPFCQFLAALPGPGEEDGEPVLSSNTIRPQAESLLDAGYYYGATYTPVTNTNQIPESVENICGLNHIILLTNGFSNGDGSPKLDVVGDADGDEYGNEDVYGLGSHWLDDVAKYLNVNYEIKTHTVLAFQTADDLVMNAAKDGDGQFYNVFNAEELSAALLDLLSNIINESSTSFVAPVVPASTTNRTISSSNVYLGLFRPQESGPWHGNIKKYGIDATTLQLTGYDGTAATDIYGNFDSDSISYWSLDANNKIPTSTTDDGFINPSSTDVNETKGDGGEVSAGGVGGVLLTKMNALAAAIKSQSTWDPTGQSWRKIYTYLDTTNSTVTTPTKNLYDAQNLFKPSNTYITSATLNLYDDSVSPPVLMSTARKDNLIRFVHGFADDEDQPLPMTASTVETRSWIMGDILHSKPVVFNYTNYTSASENTCYNSSSPSDPYNSSIIFVGANDGLIHAFRDCDGEEIWAFAPPNILPSLQYMKDPQSAHATFADSAPSLFVHDQNNDGTIDSSTDKVVLVFGQRRGGGTNILDTSSSRGAYYALDVTVPLQPKLLWDIDSDDLSEIGQTWSQPRLAKIPVDTNNFKVVAFVGAGYDNNEDLRYGNTQTFADATGIDINQGSSGGTVDGSGSPQTSSGTLTADNRYAPRGRGILAIEVAALSRANTSSAYTATISPTASGSTVGQIYWSYTFSGNDNDQLKYSFPGDLNVLDLNSDGYSDTIYTGDTGGNLWRFDVSGANTSAWNGTILFKSNPGEDSTNGRKIFYRPEVAIVDAPRIYFGTGDREHPLNMATTDRMYCVIDWGDDGTYPVTETSLVNATLNEIQDGESSIVTPEEIEEIMMSSPSSPYYVNNIPKFTYGWYVKLDGTDRTGSTSIIDPGEKVLASATVFDGEVYFSTYQLSTGTRAGCEAGNLGTSRLYQMDYLTAAAVENLDLTNDLNPDEDDSNDSEDNEVLGRTDRVRTLGEGIPSGIVTLIDASGSVTQLISSSDKVEATSSPDIKLISPVYWMQW